GTCCASARLANMAVNVTVRSSLFMRASKEFPCAPKANAARAIRGRTPTSEATHFDTLNAVHATALGAWWRCLLLARSGHAKCRRAMSAFGGKADIGWVTP